MIPNFEYILTEQGYILYNWIPSYFDWKIEMTSPGRLEVGIGYKGFDRAASVSNTPVDFTRQLADKAMAFMLKTPRYQSFLRGSKCLYATQPSLVYMQKGLDQIGRDVAHSDNHLSELEVIAHFFGVAPIPDEKILMML